MPREMISMRVGNEGGFLRVPGVHPKSHLGQMDSTVEDNIDHLRKLTARNHPANPSNEALLIYD